MSGTRRKPGPLGPYLDGYRSKQLALGYTPASVSSQLKALGRLGRWLAAEGLEVSQLSEARVEAFLAAWQAEGHLTDGADARAPTVALRTTPTPPDGFPRPAGRRRGPALRLPAPATPIRRPGPPRILERLDVPGQVEDRKHDLARAPLPRARGEGPGTKSAGASRSMMGISHTPGGSATRSDTKKGGQ